MSESTELQRAVESLTLAVKELREELVRKDVYEAEKVARDLELAAVKTSIGDLRTDVEQAETRRAGDRRLFVQGLILPVLILALQLFLAAQVGGK